MTNSLAQSATALASTLLLSFAASCSSADAGPPNVILITLDTLRSDHLGCYGYERDTSPWLDEFAARSTRYENARATSPWTLPSHASLLTGLYPFEHGSRTFRPGPGENVVPLALEHETLPEYFKSIGYDTGAVLANKVYLSQRYGLNQGFDHYDLQRTRADELNQRAVSWLEQRTPEGQEAKPAFLFLNYMDVHRPYNSVPRSDNRLPKPSSRPSAELLDELYERVMIGDGPVPTDVVDELIAHYDTAIANLDDALRQLEELLTERGIWQNSIVIVTADHGEYFGEQRLVEHSKDVYEPALRIPLIVHSPGQTSGEVRDLGVSLVDVPRMVIDHLPGELAAAGEPKFSYVEGLHPLIAENHFSRLKDLRASYAARFRRERAVLYVDEMKYVHSSDGQHELYNLDKDPGELENLIPVQKEVTQRFETALLGYQRDRKRAPGKAAELDAAHMAEMKALGYLGDENGDEDG